jgi:hypothetical protein
LLLNPNAFKIIEHNLDKFNHSDLRVLSKQPSAIHFLEKNQNIIDWVLLSQNPGIFT